MHVTHNTSDRHKYSKDGKLRRVSGRANVVAQSLIRRLSVHSFTQLLARLKSAIFAKIDRKFDFFFLKTIPNN